MIKDLNDKELLDFLMNSDYEEDLKPEDLTYLLFRFKYFYRILHGRMENAKSEKGAELMNLKDDLKSISKKMIDVKTELADKKNYIDQFESRKLTLSERWKGKLNIKNR
jgi:hypothetical protein